MTTKMTTTGEPPVLNNVVTPAQLLQIAVDKNADLDKLQQLMDLQKQWEENEARKAYHKAVAEFKTESIQILKNKTVTYENSDKTKTSYTHATLDHIVEIAAPLLAKHGLSHSWEPTQGEGGRITIKCILTHKDGYSQSRELSASPDDSGKKNNIQRMASTVTYLERYTFLAITGLAAKGQDDDGEETGERFDKSAFDAGVKKGAEYGHAWLRHCDVIYQVKDRLADDDLLAAAEALYSLTNKELISIKLAPTKGGIFTIEEIKKMSGPEWEEAKKEGHKLNPDVDRSM